MTASFVNLLLRQAEQQAQMRESAKKTRKMRPPTEAATFSQ